MKKEIVSSVLLSLVCMGLLCVVYPAIIWGVAQVAPNHGEGFVVQANNKYYYQNIAQKFTADNYFWSRPSAVDYNAAGSGGSNKGPANPDFLKTVQDRIDTFLIHNLGIKTADIPIDMITASGSGLDPNISLQGALAQVPRIAKARSIAEDVLYEAIRKNTEQPLWGLFGPAKLNVLALNMELDRVK